MKLIALMCLENCSKEARKVFEDYDVKIFSQIEISGHTSDKSMNYGSWASSHDLTIYSSLCFAIVPKEKADEIMNAIDKISKDDETGHPIRAFLMDVERMI